MKGKEGVRARNQAGQDRLHLKGRSARLRAGIPASRENDNSLGDVMLAGNRLRDAVSKAWWPKNAAVAQWERDEAPVLARFALPRGLAVVALPADFCVPNGLFAREPTCMLRHESCFRPRLFQIAP